MSQVEREIKVLKVDVNKVKNRLKEIGIEAKGKYIQDVYTFDLPTVDELFIKYVNELITAAPNVQPNEDASLYWSAFCGLDENGEKPMFTDNGKLILKYMQDHPETSSFKAKDIGEGLFISSRAVSGAIRKLVTDGYVEKIGQDPVIYTLTEQGKNKEII